VDGHASAGRPALTLSVQNFEEQGLLGMALDPNFPAQPYVYVLYTPGSNPQTGGFQRISRFTFNPANNTPRERVILHSTPALRVGYTRRRLPPHRPGGSAICRPRVARTGRDSERPSLRISPGSRAS
jgi:hypothetical protein